MSRIGVDLRILDNGNRAGLGRYAYNVTKEVLSLNSDSYELIGSFTDPLLDQANRYRIDLPHHDLDYANQILSLIGRVNDYRVLFSPFYPIPERRTFAGVLTVLDLIPLKLPEIFQHTFIYEFYDKFIRHSVKHANHILAISQCTKNDIVDLFGVDESRITVTFLAADPLFLENRHKMPTDVTILGNYNIAVPYILSVCTIEPRKNLKRTLQAYELLRSRIRQRIGLVLVGGLAWKSNELVEEIRASEYADDIVITGYVKDEELPVLYRNAEMFVYPSLYEGFGLPVLEAMACGVPTVTSNISSMPEVGGDAAVYCDPYEIDSIAEALEKVLCDPTLRTNLAKRSVERANSITWNKTAVKTREALEAFL
ncbi:glycosyltransferase family 1 protein [uncultured Paenibacillus sp.]|uniref:glycosyltransferase family 4 protein n=1 Tax=uncultured Paenibacillus sp. TaxID=227322 RepID=UPI0028D19A5C|nr:glycosyltransferase family 1 protein [uncultured Paenibacillus sp.]